MDFVLLLKDESTLSVYENRMLSIFESNKKEGKRINIVQYAIAERGLKSPTVHFTKIGKTCFIWFLFLTPALGKGER